MNLRLAGLLSLTGLLSTGCFVPDDAQPRVGFGTDYATKFVHRGMTNVDKPVLQPRLQVQMPTKWGDTVAVTAKGVFELHDTTGSAWFPDGHSGRFSQIDFIAQYERRLDDTFTVRGGIFNYNLPNGTEFPNGERGATSEVFVTVSANVLEATPYVSWHYDFDEVRGAYYRAGITEGFELGEDLTLTLDGSLGYVSSAQGSWLYALDQSGFADLRGSAILNYQWDPRTQLTAGLHGSTIVNESGSLDKDINPWFDLIGIDEDPIWFSLGVNWAF